MPPHKRYTQSLKGLNPPPATPQRKPRKKALLIGINYHAKSQPKSEETTVSESLSESELTGPRHDILAMRQLLIDQYNYLDGDIDILTDQNGASAIQPNRANILAHIKQLVDNAMPGDHFFFHYAGHTEQDINRTGTEEDGLDEYIITSDRKRIIDNELRRCLVDPLPVGSHLVAIFDSCHSGSLLDLPHYRCNRLYIPWVSKGKRRTATLLNVVVRKDAMLFPTTTRNVYQAKRTSLTSIVERKSSMFMVSTRDESDDMQGAPSRAEPLSIKTVRRNAMLLPTTMRNVYQAKQTSLKNILERKSSMFMVSTRDESDDIQGVPSRAEPLSIKTHLNSGRASSLIDLRRCESAPVAMVSNGFHKHESTMMPFPEPFFPEQPRCESPVQFFSSGKPDVASEPFFPEQPRCESPVQSFCSGLREKCRLSPIYDEEKPDVISLGSCGDGEMSWEEVAATSGTMTQALIEVLKDEPRPILREFMTKIQYKLHTKMLLVHQEARKYKKEYKKYITKHANVDHTTKADVEMDNFQNPVLSSFVPLDLDKRRFGL